MDKADKKNRNISLSLFIFEFFSSTFDPRSSQEDFCGKKVFLLKVLKIVFNRVYML